MKNTLNRIAAAALLPALLFAGCSRRNEATVGTPANPLVVVLSPAHTPATNDAADFIKKHLETATGMTVALRIAKSPAEAINAFNSGSADAGLVTLEEYLVAREEYGVRPLLQALRGDRLPDYDGVILTKAAGGAASVADLANRRFGFVGPYSVSGFTLPALFLEKAGVKVLPEFSRGHDENFRKLESGAVFAAATYARQASRVKGLKVLAVTGTVPNEPLITRHSLAEDKRAALKAAFLALGDTKEGRKAMGELADITGFRPADEMVYRPLHDLLLQHGKAVYDLVPDGWDIYKLNQPYIPER
jgi:ABC-type phosphate/phosphonate transport system substrate-binding protein